MLLRYLFTIAALLCISPEAEACSPGDTLACSVDNGHGVFYCTADGEFETSACSVLSCDNGYSVFDNGAGGICHSTNLATTSMPIHRGQSEKEVSSLTTAISSSMATTTQVITAAVKTATSQALTVKAASDVSLAAATEQANAALLLCAQGANREAEAPGSGAGDISACRGKFSNADSLTAMTAKNGGDPALKRDEGLLGQEVSVETLEKFQANFGIDKDEYVRRMLAARGNRSEFAEILSSKFSDHQLDELLTDASEEQPAGSEWAVAESPAASAVSAPKPVVKKETSLRDSLRAKIDAAEAGRKPASAGALKTEFRAIKSIKENLLPAGLDTWINGSDDQQEAIITLFDVIHQKLQSLKQREKI